MKITAVEAIPIAVPLTKPIVMSHITIEQSNNVLVRVETDEGVVGWGEGVEATDLTGETQDSIRAALELMGPRIVGRDAMRRTELWWDLDHMMYANETAVGAIDMALYDIAGKVHGVPVYELIGGKMRDRVPALTMVGSGKPEDDIAAAVAKHANGFTWFKVKLGIGDPADELETMKGLRTELPPNVVVSGDANQGWSEAQSIKFLQALDGYDITFIEQPIPQGDNAAMIRVAQASPVPICADQSIHSLSDILAFGRTGVAGVSLKMVKLGGITGVMRGAALCDSLGLKINLAGKIAESSVAATANVHLATAMKSIDFGCSPANQGLSRDVTSNPLPVVDGHFEAPTAPGLGIDVDLVGA